LRAATESFAPRGNLLMTGVVVEAGEEFFLLRKRDGTRQLVQIRKDTHFFGSGEPLDRHGLPLNRPLQVRGGRTFENEIEAFSVIWGDILKPTLR
jgi:hypothetical protein